jgi:hypothetical protein
MTIDPQHEREASHRLDTVRAEWMSRTGVHAVEVARLWRDGRPPTRSASG